MRNRVVLAGSMIFVGALAAGAASRAEPEPVWKVGQVAICGQARQCPVPVLVAMGHTRTAGWEHPRLEVLEVTGEEVQLQFLAEPPGGMAAQVISDVVATMALPEAWSGKTVIVCAEENEASVHYEGDAGAGTPE